MKLLNGSLECNLSCTNKNCSLGHTVNTNSVLVVISSGGVFIDDTHDQVTLLSTDILTL